MNDGFRIGIRPEGVTARDQIVAQLFIVVDFAVENDPDRSVFIRDGLMS